MRNGILKTDLQRSEDAHHAAEFELAITMEMMARNAQALADALRGIGCSKRSSARSEAQHGQWSPRCSGLARG
jgi:hypothetical protein